MTNDADAATLVPDETAPTTRCRILATAERFFHEIGYQKTTVADIAKALRMSPANVYRFFESKKAINEAVVARVIEDIEALIATIADAPGRSATDRIADIVRALHHDCVERCRANPRMHEMVEAAMSESWEVCGRHVSRIGAVLVRVVGEGMRDGEFGVADAEVAALCVQAAIVRYCNPLLVSLYPNIPGPPLEDMIGFLLRGLRAPSS
ncbi:TetR family transcriptional regulator [Methylobacterium sp. Leaf399]|uniref:TetR/AcrR family transcriptional regulator n=1 Tax=unclassified Methylobacterium TaxID=2615210 RepID=UPI0006FA81B4|nr:MULTISPECIES: TetR/AcrR family transcriptional regulator [unclassified Methylobacterium]KQP61350.1 TetR family transcriptional regulator [Methylobacterium sp. Leaf108]KQT19497.1 TetR family transcriptional regulator [Methylobacterium sp. Leaf399]KQT78103.1 TetR family transcriptional regulator [Methylobacterium sp. Leaf466]